MFERNVADQPLVTDMRLRSAQSPVELAAQLADMHLDDAAVKGLLESVGLRFKANCVLLTIESQWVTCKAIWGEPFKYGEMGWTEAPPFFRTIRRPAPIIINDIAKLRSRVDGVTLDPAVLCYTSSPIVISGKYVGSLVMTCLEPKTFKLNDLDHLQHTASQIGKLLDDKLQNTVPDALAP